MYKKIYRKVYIYHNRLTVKNYINNLNYFQMISTSIIKIGISLVIKNIMINIITYQYKFTDNQLKI